jgi:hypothetical protein
MPEVQEVFRLATQKVRPDPGFEDRQYDYRRKKERNRKIGAFAFVAGIGAVAAVLVLRSVPERQSQPAAPPPTSVGPNSTGSTTVGRVTTTLTVEGVTFSFRDPPCAVHTPVCSWERHGAAQPLLPPSEREKLEIGYPSPASVNSSVMGPQSAEAIIYWTSFPDGEYADPCANLLSPPVPQSAADLAAAVAAAPGTELVTGPSDVTVGGRPAKHVVLTVREDLGCDPGFFYTWQAGLGGANWLSTDVGDTIRVWIVDVDGTLLFIEAETVRDLESRESRTFLKDLEAVGVDGFPERQINQIVDSIRFH